VLGCVAFVIPLAFPSQANIEQQIRGHNPVQALQYLRASGQTGRVLNDYLFGGYLIWAAPERKVFIDGRSDVFEPAGVISDYMKWTLLQTDPNAFLEKNSIDVCLFSRDAPVTRVLSLLSGWKKAYSDDVAMVFVRQRGF
jgi:hypothetical protein